MKKNIRGFTLIELLAVIVILAIIALIAVPIILNVIEESKKGAAKASARGILDAAEIYMSSNNIDSIQVLDLKNNNDILYNGKRPERGYLLIKEGKSEISVVFGNYCVKKLFNEISPQIVVDDDCGKYKEIEQLEITLADNMIPIRYDGNKWVKADQTNKDNNWYNYNQQKWANAATIVNNKREIYKTVAIGTPILEVDILTYMTWIPRYEYQYTNLYDQYAGGTKELPGEIKINIIGKSTISPSNSNYIIHPAFTFDGTNLPGFWVGKFETTGSFDECINEQCNVSNMTIKPNLSSVRNKNLSNMFFASRSMSSNSSNPYGYNNNVDSHMMKNSEWAAVAYLSHSKYGKYGNTDYSGIDKEVGINNNSLYKTGCGGEKVNSSETTSCNEYNTVKGQSASTTGNITGIYDMNGGAYEYVMANYINDIGASGFDNMPSAKYYDYFFGDNHDEIANICKNGLCRGQAIDEVIDWYNYDTRWFIDFASPWLIRGGLYQDSKYEGIFTFARYNGYEINDFSFRIVHK